MTIDRPGLWHLRDVVNHLQGVGVERKPEGAYEAVLVEVDKFDAGEERYGVELKGVIRAFRRAGTDRRLC